MAQANETKPQQSVDELGGRRETVVVRQAEDAAGASLT